MKRAFLAAAMMAAMAALAPASAQQNTLKVVLPGELRSIDSDWTAAAITRYHSFMVYDTLLGLDANQQIQPQMADRFELSDDKPTCATSWPFRMARPLRRRTWWPAGSAGRRPMAPAR